MGEVRASVEVLVMGVPVVAVVAAWMITVVAGDIVGGARRIVDVPPLTDWRHAGSCSATEP